MTYDQENVLYWLIGAAKFGYQDLGAVQEWAGSDVDTKELKRIIDELWDIQTSIRLSAEAQKK